MPEIELSENLKKELKAKLEAKLKKRKEDAKEIKRLLKDYFPDVETFVDANGRLIINIVDTLLRETDFNIVWGVIRDMGYSTWEYEVCSKKKDKVGVTFFI